jgi:hypothetical protein
MIKVNQIHILISDFVNYFIMNEKENLAELSRTDIIKQYFFLH